MKYESKEVRDSFLEFLEAFIEEFPTWDGTDYRNRLLKTARDNPDMPLEEVFEIVEGV